MLISATISTLPLWRRRYTKGTFLELPAFVEVTGGWGTRGRELRQNDYREPDDCCSWTHKSCGNLTILRSLRGREDRHGYRYTHIYVLHIYCMCKLLHSNAAVLLTPCGSAGRGKPKTKSKQRKWKVGGEGIILLPDYPQWPLRLPLGCCTSLNLGPARKTFCSLCWR